MRTGYSSYHRSGEVLHAMVAIGLHGDIKVDEKTPFFLATIRQQVKIQAYSVDISLAAFLGRPPRLSYRFCVLGSPDDIEDADLLLEGNDWKQALQNLDENGWNMAGRFTRHTWLKAYLDISKTREDILEMALTPAGELLHRAEIIRQRAAEQLAKYPKFLREEWTRPWYEQSPGPAPRTLYSVCLRLEYLSNDLLLQRVLVKSAGADHWTLVQTAKSIFKEVLMFVSRPDLTRDVKIDLSWILLAHGLRSAAIVAIQFLKQELISVATSECWLPRSETIQDLSVFANFLSALHRDDGNHFLCDQANRVIKRILDKVLEMPQKPPPQLQNFRDEHIVPTLDPILDFENSNFDLNASVNLVYDADFLQWLENMEWDTNGMPSAVQMDADTICTRV